MADTQNLTAEQKDVLNALQQPVSNEKISDAHIGIFSLENANLGTTTHINPNASIENWRNGLTRDTRVLDSKDISEIDKELNNKYKGEVAHAKEGVINLPNYEMNEQLAQELKNNEKLKFHQTVQYMMNNTIVKIEVMGHERTHYHHLQQHRGANDTPYMAAQSTDMTEQIANFNEYMTVAHIWKNAKQSGAKTITVNDQTIATDDILNYMPNLKDEVLKNGFDEKDPACRERIAKVASDYWNSERAEFYAVNARKNAKEALGITDDPVNKTPYALAGAIVNAQEWEQRKQLMVENLKTGDGVTYSAPECLKYFVPSEERTQEIIKDLPNVSNEDLLKIGAYLDKKGLKTDDEKEMFITEQMIYITKRDSKADKDFANLLVSVCPPDKQEILYADGISVKYDKDVATVTKGKVNFTAPITTLADNAQLHQQIKSQTGKYPPDAPTAEIDQARTLADKQMSNACAVNDYHKEKEAAKIEKQTEKSTVQASNSAALLKANQQNTL